jgi:hypothetical protein
MGLVTRTAEIEIGDPAGRQHPEGIGKALGAEVDPAIRRRRRDKEHALPRDHRDLVFAKAIGEICHGLG